MAESPAQPPTPELSIMKRGKLRLESAKDKVNEAIQTLHGAETDADELQGQMAAAGIQDKVEAFAAIKDGIERARAQLASGVDLVEEATNQAQAAAG